MTFDIWRNVLVMRECVGQRGIVGMRLWVVPIQSLPGLFDSIAVRLNSASCKVQVFPNLEYNAIGEFPGCH